MSIRVAEILGPPGAGKTTALAGAVRQVPQIRPVRAFRAPRNAAAYAGAVLKVAPLLPHVARQAVAEHSGTQPGREAQTPPGGYLRANWLIRLQAAPRVLRGEGSRGDKVVVFDQGPVYTLVRLHDLLSQQPDTFKRWWQASLETWAQRLDLVLLLDAADGLLLQRIRSRSKGHALEDVQQEAAVAALSEYRARCEAVAYSLAEAGRTRVVRLDTGVLERDAVLAAVVAELRPVAGRVRTYPSER